MEAERNLEAEIQQLEARLQQISTANQENELKLSTEEQQLAALQQQIESIILPEHFPDLQLKKEQNVSFIKQRSRLEHELQLQSEWLTNSTISQTAQIDAIKHQQQELLQQSKATVTISHQQLERLKEELRHVQSAVKDEKEALEHETAHISREESEKAQTNQQLSKLSSLLQETQLSIHSNQATHDQEAAALQKELQALERQFNEYHQQIAQVKQQSEQTVTALKLSKENISRKLADEQHIRDALIQQSAALKTKLEQQVRQCSVTHKNNAERDEKISKLELQIKKKDEEIDAFKLLRSSLSEDIRREEDRIKQEQRRHKQRNYKELINQASSEQEKLLREREREENILNNNLKIWAGYTSKENLEILQRQLNRHQNPKAPSLELKINESEKLKWKNKQLADGIKRLKRLRSDAEAKEEKGFNEATRRRDQLTADKLQVDKQTTETAYKLNEYIKKFPNHDQNKEEKRKFAIKRTESVVDNPEPKPKKQHKPLEDSDYIILDDGELPEPEPDSEGSKVFKKTKWYKRRSSSDLEMEPETPIYKNHYFQAATLLFLLLLFAIFNL